MDESAHWTAARGSMRPYSRRVSALSQAFRHTVFKLDQHDHYFVDFFFHGGWGQQDSRSE